MEDITICEEREEQEKREQNVKMLNAKNQCRYYKNKYPRVNDNVIIEIDRIENVGVYVILPEYKGASGFIPISELSTQQAKNINSIRVGSVECACVISVDEKKGYIDLTKKNITEDAITQCNKKYYKSKSVHNVMNKLSISLSETDYTLKKLYEMVGWPLYEKYEHAYDGFIEIRDDPSILDEYISLSETSLKECLLKMIQQAFPIKQQTILSIIHLSYNGYDGIEAIKRALKKGVRSANTPSTDDEIYVRHHIAPEYCVSMVSSKPKAICIEQIEQSVEAIRVHFERDGGEFKIIKKAYVKGDETETDAESDTSDDNDEASLTNDDINDINTN